MNRRHLLRTSLGTSAALTFGLSAQSSSNTLSTLPLPVRDYHGWPTVTRLRNGELWVAWSGGREEHICPFGQLQVSHSKDDGKTWSYPRVLLDGALDDRDGGIVETAQGTLLATSFSSDAYVPILKKAIQENKWPAERLQAWQQVHNRVTDAQRKELLGCWLVRSTDGGLNWSERLATPVNSPHGPIVTQKGRLLYPGKELWSESNKCSLYESKDDGLTWEWISDIPTRPQDDIKKYHELHMVEAQNGDLILQIRNHNKDHNQETLQCESSDGGKTWSTPREIGVWGLPSHLLRLKNGDLLMTYGHRRAPLGNFARLSKDHGKTWGQPITVSDDAVSGDLGYPSTVELENNELLTVWYEVIKGNPKAILRQAIWKL